MEMHAMFHLSPQFAFNPQDAPSVHDNDTFFVFSFHLVDSSWRLLDVFQSIITEAQYLTLLSLSCIFLSTLCHFLPSFVFLAVYHTFSVTVWVTFSLSSMCVCVYVWSIVTQSPSVWRVTDWPMCVCLTLLWYFFAILTRTGDVNSDPTLFSQMPLRSHANPALPPHSNTFTHNQSHYY